MRVGNRLVGEEQPALLVAEVGINHNGDIDLAHRMVEAAADAGADAVKFQNYHAEDFITDRSLTYKYISQGHEVIENQYDMFKRCELSLTALRELRQECTQRNLIFFSTPTSERGVKELVDLGVPLLKNGSDFLQNLSLIQAMAKTGLPCMISTGMGTLVEIEEAVRAFREAGGEELILLVCTSMYPTPPEETHLRRIPTLAARTGIPVGFSDHTLGIVAAIGAVALGACAIEKHFTISKDLPGPDHHFSADPTEFKSLVQNVRALEKSLGSSTLGPTLLEKPIRNDFRLSCAASRDLAAGQQVTDADILFSRPGTGFPPKAKERLVGKRLVHKVIAGHIFKPEDFS